MEESKGEVAESVKSILIKKDQIRKSHTYGPSGINGLVDKKKKKKVVFADRTKNLNLCTYFNYEQVEVQEDEKSPKSTSCTCAAF
jgi:hypothetical protein